MGSRAAIERLQPLLSAEITDALPVATGSLLEIRRDVRQSFRRADRRARHDQRVVRADKTDDRLADWREPKLDTRIDDLVSSGVPTIAENQFARLPEVFGVKADFVSRSSHAATLYQSGCCPAAPARDFTQTAGAF